MKRPFETVLGEAAQHLESKPQSAEVAKELRAILALPGERLSPVARFLTDPKEEAWDQLIADVRNVGPASYTPEETVAIDSARAVYADPSHDDLEIDEQPCTSIGDGGIWVAAWVWVRNPDAEDEDEDDTDEDEIPAVVFLPTEGAPSTNPSGHGYCGTLNDNQVRNVLAREQDGMERHYDNRYSSASEQSAGWHGAKELRDEARTELVHRGLMHPSER